LSNIPDYIRMSAKITESNLAEIDEATSKAFNVATDLCDNINKEEHPSPHYLVEQGLQALRRAYLFFEKVADLNAEYAASADQIEKEEAAQTATNDATALGEAILRMIDKSPESNVHTIQLRKVSSTETEDSIH